MKPRVYLIDYENVHKEGLEGVEALSRSDKVVVFYSAKADSICIALKLWGRPLAKRSIQA